MSIVEAKAALVLRRGDDGALNLIVWPNQIQMPALARLILALLSNEPQTQISVIFAWESQQVQQGETQ